MQPVLDPREYYLTVLSANGFTPPEDTLTKVAAAKGKDFAVVKLAQAYFEQSQLDGMPYVDEKSRAADSMKMAEAYFAHVKEREDQAVKIATGLTQCLEHAVQAFITSNALALTPLEAVKVAGLQALSLIEAEVKTAMPAVAAGPAPGGISTPHTTAALATHGNIGAVMDHYQVPAGSSMQHVEDALQRYAQTSHGMPVGTAHNHVLEAMRGQQGGSMLGGHGKMLAGAGLGLGALYLLNKRNNDETNRKDQQIAALRAAALPQA